MKKHLLAIAILGSVVAQATAASNIAYMSSAGEPWGASSNLQAMDAAFGAGAWDRTYFSSFTAASLTGLDFLYVDGGDGNSDDFNSFIAANFSVLETWVAAGNNLLLNAGRWSGGEDYWGFGTSVMYPSFSSDGHAVDGGHPIFTGAGTSWTGNYFSHDVVFDTSLTSLIESSAGDVLLVEGQWGLGNIMIGGLTSTVFHQPEDLAFQLRVNMLDYMADGQIGREEQPVPEVQHYAAMLGAALAGVEMMRRRRKA